MYYVADFETNTLTDKEEKDLLEGTLKAKDLETGVWAWGITEVGNTDDDKIIINQSINSFIEYVYSIKVNPKIYFHNLKFDGHFIMSYLLNNGFEYYNGRTHIPDKTFSTLINDAGQFYSIVITFGKRKGKYHKVTFLDSYKKLPFSIDRIAKAFQLEYNKIEVGQDFYKKVRGKDYVLTDFDIEYIRHDLKVPSQALQILHHQGMDAMTTGSDALNNYKMTIGKNVFESTFPVLEKEVDDDIKLAYRGGMTWVKEEIRNKEIGIGKSFDVNSMYPSVMRYKKLPYGVPLWYDGKYKKFKDYDLYIQQIKCEFKIKDKHVPTLQIKNQPAMYKPTEYLTKSVAQTTLHLTNIDLELLFKHYEVWNIEYQGGYMFKSSSDNFIEYIDYWNEVKAKSTGAMRELAKLMLNSLYGKFGTKTMIRSKHPRMDEHGIVKLDVDDGEEIKPIYSAIAVFTTSYGRKMLIDVGQANYDRFCYCDTDSIHVTGIEPLNNLELHPTKLGAWDDEGTFSRAKFIGAKCYVEDFPSGLKVTVAGMTKAQHSQVTYENFKEGLVVSGKLVPKVVKGGVVLVGTEYAVKVRGFRS